MGSREVGFDAFEFSFAQPVLPWHGLLLLLNHASRDYGVLNVVSCRADILKAFLPLHAQSLAARDDDEWREEAVSIS